MNLRTTKKSENPKINNFKGILETRAIDHEPIQERKRKKHKKEQIFQIQFL